MLRNKLELLMLVALIITPFTIVTGDWIPLLHGTEGDKPVVTVLESDAHHVMMDIEIPGMWAERVQYEERAFDKVIIPGEGMLGILGEPNLPVIGRLLAIPGNTGISAQVIERETIELSGYEITPAIKQDRCGNEPELVMDENLYASDQLYPAQIVQVEKPSIWRDFRVTRLQLNPVQYNPAANKLVVSVRLRVDVQFIGKSSINAKVYGDSGIARGFAPLYERLLLNYTEFKRDEIAAEPYVIITYDSFAANLQPLVDWKRKKGFDVTVVLKSTIGTTAQEIKNYLQNIYNTWDPKPVYVLLVGDIGQIPTFYGIESCASDYMYTTLEGTDINPDIFIGRLVAQTTAEVDTQVAKFVNYEMNPIVGTTYHEKGMGISSSLTGPAGVSDDTRANNVRADWLSWGMTSVDQLYQSNGQNSATNVTNYINEGRAWVCYFGHGSGTSWSNTNPAYSNSHVDALTNGFRLPVIVDVSCLNGGFAGSSDCFAERWMKGGTATNPHGAVGMFSASTSTAWDEPAIMSEGVTEAYVLNGHYSWAACTQAGLLWLENQMGSGSNVLEVFQQYVLFGDPSLLVYTDEPAQIAVNMLSNIPLGAVDVEFTVTKNGQPFQNALICCRKGEEFTTVGTTNSIGQVTLTLEPQTIGNIEVSVTGLNILPYTGTIQVMITGCGALQLNKSLYACDQIVQMNLWEADLNLNPSALDQAQVTVRSNSEPTPETVTLTETGVDTGAFTGGIQLSTTQSGVGYLLVSHGDTVTATYQDADCDGSPVTVEDTATSDCEGPVISGVLFSDLLDDTVTISWTTTEASNSVVRYGFTSPPTLEATDAELVTAHEIVLEGLTMCSQYFFEVSSTDISGNTATDNNGGSYYMFNTLGNFVMLEANMDTNPNWQISGGQWAWGQPTGQGGAYGSPDPTSGYTGSNVYGYNLNGDYGASIPAYHLVTPSFDCSTAVDTKLRFYRWLGVETNSYDHAVISVSTNGTTWTEIFHNSSTIADDAWLPQEFDISDYADGHSTVYLRWTMGPSDYGWQYCGWNIDDVEVSYLGPCNTPVILHDSHVIDDSTGNNNQMANPGETVTMPLTIYNNSSIEATNVSVLIGTSVAGITIIDNQASFPSVPAHTAVTSLAPHFSWTSTSATPDNTLVTFSAAWTSAEGSGTFSFSEVVVTPMLVMGRNVIDDSTGNNDGIADPGETITLEVKLQNTGHDTATTVLGTLSTQNTDVTIDDNSASFPDISPAQEVTSLPPHFTITVHPDAVVGSEANFAIHVTAGAYTWDFTFSMVIGASPVLIIDECGTCTSASILQSALEAEGYLVENETTDTTDPSTWVDYQFIVWSSGNMLNPLQGTMTDELITYVQNGHRLLIEGGEIGYEHNADSFATTVLHINDWYSDSSGNLTLDLPTHMMATIPYTLPATITSTYSSYGDQDSVASVTPAQAVMGWSSNSYAGVITYDNDSSTTNGGQIVYFSFNVATLSNTQLERTHLISNAAYWLRGMGQTQPTITPTVNATATPTRTPTTPPTVTPTPILTPTPTQIPPTDTPIVPTVTPTQPPPTATSTPSPTQFVPTYTPVPTEPPTETPVLSPTPNSISITLSLNQETYYPSDNFLLTCTVINPGPTVTLEQYIILDVLGLYFFWDGWTQELDYRRSTLEDYSIDTETILEFAWPSGAGEANDIGFWGAFLEPGTINLVGNISHITFGWSY